MKQETTDIFKLPPEIENDSGPLPFMDFRACHPDDTDCQEEIEFIDGYVDYIRENRGENLTFGDY